MIKTLHTYVGQKAVCQRARRWLADRNVLTKTEELKRGHYRFTMHIPTHWDEAKARSWLATALTLRGDVHYEPPVYEEAEGEDLDATRRRAVFVARSEAFAIDDDAGRTFAVYAKIGTARAVRKAEWKGRNG